jgi:hypothetical protein
LVFVALNYTWLEIHTHNHFLFLPHAYRREVLGGSDRPTGLDFLFQLNIFVNGHVIDAEHLIRRALFGSNTLVSINLQTGMDGAGFVNRYATAGLIVNAENKYSLPEFHFPIPGNTCKKMLLRR